MMRRFVAVLVGGLAAMAVILACELIGQRLFPPPPGLDVHDMAAVRALIRAAPPAETAWLLSGYAAGAFSGGAVAAWLGRALGPALVVGVVLTAAGTFSMVELGHPTWAVAAGLACHLPFAMAGGTLALHRLLVLARTSATPG